MQAIKGNVEDEIARSQDSDYGCGCAYPEYVDQGVVDRSNIIIQKLREVASKFKLFYVSYAHIQIVSLTHNNILANYLFTLQFGSVGIKWQ
jgi:hypothetical protein